MGRSHNRNGGAAVTKPKSSLVRGSTKWRERGEGIIAGLRETIQRLRELGRDAAEAGDIETGWFCDKQMKDLERRAVETQNTLDKHKANKPKEGL